MVSFDVQIKSGKAKLDANQESYEQLKTMLVHSDVSFELMPGEGCGDLTPERKPFEQEQQANASRS